jgi:hypothetical protein
MRAEDLVFWIDVLPDHDDAIGGVLCRRHADSMVVPRGWTLDDLRDPDLHLFRPPPAVPTGRSRGARATPRPTGDATGEQLRLDPEIIAGADGLTLVDLEPGPWTPSFDEADDLGGLLAADSPLLSRAFRTADRSGQ